MANFTKGHEALQNKYLLQPTSLEDPVLFNSREGLEVLQSYGGVPKDEVLAHALQVRDKAWAKYTFPCIGMLAFLHFSISQTSAYPEILERVKGGDSVIDFGTFFGQDLRKLAADGAPTDKLYGTDIEGYFWDLGYELFRDSSRFRGTFIEADSLDTSDSSPLLSQLRGQISIIHCSHFLHLFPRADTVKIISELFLPLLKPEPGSMIVGRNVGLKEARMVKTLVASQSSRVSNPEESFSHNAETWRELLDEVSERTGTRWEFEVEQIDLDAYGKGAGFVQVPFICRYLGRA
ncbi:hypothetical protein B0J12DRAFT_630145 [Macrophomina phaseolina]|uniref:Methyltransferase domain-containing protein n=1 Tax=Macrophomina phaseolina TaxID=35725 RepID=A0ABQ8G1J3_9PEZI|nr:hypothetical protein B0J12DRAFT_630145 [Macrophomina phaseolina]